MRRCKAVHLSILLVRKEFSDIIIDFEIGHGIRTAALSYRVLVDIFNLCDTVEIAGQPTECTRRSTGLIEMTIYCRIEDVTDKRRFSTAADSRHDSKHTERKSHVDILHIMLHSTFNRYMII